ncbi:hypothetical protein CsSME_00039589 [Camellia sinensis var. sinensis]
MSGGEETSREGGMLKLKSFIHEHPLTLSDELLNGENCTECGLHILAPTSSCMTCKFFIHKSCVELPYEIHYPLPPDHPLTLANPPCPPAFSGISFCELCLNVRDDNSFYYTECHFSLNSHCALSIPTTFQHVGHDHPLTLLINYYGTSIHCKAKSYPLFFWCTMGDCLVLNFVAIDFNCAFLPLTRKHKTHRHQLKLTILQPSPLKVILGDDDEECYLMLVKKSGTVSKNYAYS